MIVLKTVDEAVKWRHPLTGSVGYVASLGGLHRGHEKIFEHAAAENDALVVSLFVNPTQFADGEDYETYPADIDDDLATCRRCGADAVFVPSAAEMFPAEFSTVVRVSRFRGVLCDVSRPHHFDGVTTVVDKLFNILRPSRSYFGKKDYQQLRLIQQMVLDLNQPIVIVPFETVREPDGLAVSTRNSYLSESERAVAPRLYSSLQWALGAFRDGLTSWNAFQLGIRERVEAPDELMSLEYAEALDRRTLAPMATLNNEVVIAVAARCGAARLIDNIELGTAL